MDCLSAAVLALKLLGMTLQTIPAIGIGPEFSRGGYTNYGGQGVVILRDAQDCYTLAHELIHHYQTERFGWTEDEREVWKREQDAARLTMLAAVEYRTRTGEELKR